MSVPLFNPTASYCELCRARRLRAHSASDPADGRRDAGRRRFESGGWQDGGRGLPLRRSLGKDWRIGRLYVPGNAALLRHHAARVRLLDSRQRLGTRDVLVPFILATSFLGQTLGLVFRHRETAVLLVLASSLPQFFLVGVSWPAEALPGFLRQARELLPSVSAIDGMVRINQMGASLFEVRDRWGALWASGCRHF